jgi:hypothetical protein
MACDTIFAPLSWCNALAIWTLLALLPYYRKRHWSLAIEEISRSMTLPFSPRQPTSKGLYLSHHPYLVLMLLLTRRRVLMLFLVHLQMTSSRPCVHTGRLVGYAFSV